MSGSRVRPAMMHDERPCLGCHPVGTGVAARNWPTLVWRLRSTAFLTTQNPASDTKIVTDRAMRVPSHAEVTAPRWLPTHIWMSSVQTSDPSQTAVPRPRSNSRTAQVFCA
jgi:hypothetical protein